MAANFWLVQLVVIGVFLLCLVQNRSSPVKASRKTIRSSILRTVREIGFVLTLRILTISVVNDAVVRHDFIFVLFHWLVFNLISEVRSFHTQRKLFLLEVDCQNLDLDTISLIEQRLNIGDRLVCNLRMVAQSRDVERSVQVDKHTKLGGSSDASFVDLVLLDLIKPFEQVCISIHLTALQRHQNLVLTIGFDDLTQHRLVHLVKVLPFFQIRVRKISNTHQSMDCSSQGNIESIVCDVLDKSTDDVTWSNIRIGSNSLVLGVLCTQRNVHLLVRVVNFQDGGCADIICREDVVQLVGVVVQCICDERNGRHLFSKLNNHITFSGLGDLCWDNGIVRQIHKRDTALKVWRDSDPDKSSGKVVDVSNDLVIQMQITNGGRNNRLGGFQCTLLCAELQHSLVCAFVTDWQETVVSGVVVANDLDIQNITWLELRKRLLLVLDIANFIEQLADIDSSLQIIGQLDVQLSALNRPDLCLGDLTERVVIQKLDRLVNRVDSWLRRFAGLFFQRQQESFVSVVNSDHMTGDGLVGDKHLLDIVTRLLNSITWKNQSSKTVTETDENSVGSNRLDVSMQRLVVDLNVFVRNWQFLVLGVFNQSRLCTQLDHTRSHVFLKNKSCELSTDL
ncbi:hypothetical protein OGAPHI_000676 [Ogataea philodendri]|uniref:Uncharacterized protein n=1 Tax=Ogataea philodendri TaxID=1378263 RepID=A0A9P8PG24_9ASCO|nr:uncharacterized protein OGAPHI_000676 [Ogataea philodendri]KAH3670965.1 hypothetical protein OGAPHI_000676 [Ogataea philodendri]